MNHTTIDMLRNELEAMKEWARAQEADNEAMQGRIRAQEAEVAALKERSRAQEARLEAAERRSRRRLAAAAAVAGLAVAWASTPESRAQFGLTLTGLNTRLIAVEAKTAPQSMSADGTTLTFSGVNVQIIDGTGSTVSNSGLGNLTVGYNALRGHGDDARTGSHNLVLGDANNYTSSGGLVAGSDNSITGTYSSVSAGQTNTASGFASSISGGINHTASGDYSSVSGGGHNTASANASSVSGGESNFATAIDASVSGGFGNLASGFRSSVSGGAGVTAAADNSWAAGGFHSP
jgi:hypothetical protein